MKGYFAVIMLFLALSCKKHSSQADNTCPDYKKGYVIVGLKNTVPIEQAFSFVDSNNLSIESMSGFFYTNPYPEDSLPGLISYLDTKPYINAKGFHANAYINHQTGLLTLASTLYNMDLASQHDWANMANQLQLTDLNNDTKYMILLVPDGMENYWVTTFLHNDQVKWAELNCILQADPF